MEICRYSADLAGAWNDLNRRAVNGHFLFDRGFMDYHADRFADGSLVVLEGGQPIALLPANLKAGEAFSHQGLTFGGLIHAGLGAARTLQALDACAEALVGAGASALTYKALPWIYPRSPTQDDLYWLFLRDAVLVRRDASAAIDYRARGRVSSRRERGVKKAAAAGLTFAQSQDWPGFWRLLEGVLAERHGAAPVHSLPEIELLAGRFPGEVALFTAADADGLQAGVVMFRSAQVAHAQYIAANAQGRETGALDGLFGHLIGVHAESHRFFDFGISNTDDGRVLNEGLMRQKEEFGAGVVVHDVWRVTLA